MTGLRLPHLGGGRQKVLDQQVSKMQAALECYGALIAAKRVLWRLQGGLCAACAEKLVNPNNKRVERRLRCSMEHVIPKSKGGAVGFGNVLVTHLGCNERKADRMPTGCEMIWLLAVNARLGVEPTTW